MKKYIFCLLICIPGYLQSQDLMSDYASYCKDTNNNRVNVDAVFGNNSFIFNGITYVFRFNTDMYCIPSSDPTGYPNGCPEFYTFNPSDQTLHPLDLLGDVNHCDYRWNPCITYFHYPYERDYVPNLFTNVFAFNYNGQLWYLQTIESKDKKSYYECFAKLPMTNHTAAYTYYTSIPIPDTTDWVWVKMCAFQMDEYMYFFRKQVLYKNLDVETGTWYIQKYAYNADKNRFDWVSDINLEFPNGVEMNGGTMTFFRRHDPTTDQDYLILCLYNPGMMYFFRLDLTDTGSKVTFLNTAYQSMVQGGVAVIPGSIQAKRQPSNVVSPEESDRFTLFAIWPDKVSGDYPLKYQEFYFDTTNVPHLVGTGTITNPIGSYPKKMGDFFSLSATTTLEPHHYTNKLSNSSSYWDGYQQKIWLFFPDTKQDIFAVGFNSDIWQPSPSVYDTIYTSNLTSDTGTIAAQLQSLSTLVGIVDGGPPCSVDWEKWDSAYPPGTALAFDPTALELSSSSTQKIENTTSTNDEFTVGMSMKFMQEMEVAEIPLSLEEGVGFQYAGAFKRMYSTGSEIINKLTTGFPLRSATQNQGAYIWAIPSITRYVFRRYAWWDAYPNQTYQYPVPNSLQYMFRTTGINYITQSKPISGFPFRVADPNDYMLKYWTTDSVIYGKAGRKEIGQLLFDYPAYSRLTNSNWTSPWDANNGTFEEMTDTTITNETENKFSLEVEAGMKIPEVFKLKATAGYEITYSSEVKSTSSFGHEIKLAINLTPEMTNYIYNKKNLSIDLYLLKKTDSISFWYWDSIPNPSQKPWYIAYVVTDASKKVKLVSPENNGILKPNELLFNWQTENMEESFSVLYISKSWPVTPNSIVYEENAGGVTVAVPVKFKPEKGVSYVWAVRVIDQSGSVI